MSEYQGCHKCKYGNKQPTDYPCLECEHNRAIDHYEPMTNADRIRNMTDEELLEILINFSVCNACEYSYTNTNGYKLCGSNDVCTKKSAKQGALQWLQAEVKEG